MNSLAPRPAPPHVRLALLAKVPAAVLIGVVRAYQLLLRPLLGGKCRFEPSCSRYAVACLERHGAVRGGLLSLKRLCKCHPFHPGGHDPPPGTASSRRERE